MDSFCRLDASHRGSAWRQGNQGKLRYTISSEISRSRSKFWSILVFPWKVRSDFIDFNSICKIVEGINYCEYLTLPFFLILAEEK